MKSNRIFAAICAFMMMVSLAGCCGNENKTDEKAKYVFLFIGDGMGNSHVAAAESYLSYKTGKLGGEQVIFTQFPYLGLCTTYSANKNITDSSASGTAIACGEKTNNGMLGVDPEGNPVRSMAYDFKEDGYKVGIMSSVTINHATPGSFYGHNVSRSDYYSISQEIPATDFEFFGGSGFGGFNGKDGKQEDIDIYLERNGYEVCYGVDEFNQAAPDTERIIFCQESNRKESAGNYVTGSKVAEDVPLSKIVELAVDYLGDKDPFFIMCEGGAIDWEAHANRTMGTVMEVLDLDAAVKVAYEFYLAHPDETLIVVTADHETGGIALGSNGGGSNINWAKLEEEWKNGNDKKLSDEEHTKFSDSCSIGWTTGDHTGGAVPVYAIGKGAEKFGGRMDNTDIKGKILGK